MGEVSHLMRRARQDDEEHDVSKELFLGIMMLMLCLGIMVLNVASPVWRVHRHDPEPGDVVVVYTERGYGLSVDGIAIERLLTEAGFRSRIAALVSEPETELHLVLKGGSRERLVRHAAMADSLLSTDSHGRKVRAAVYVHGW